MDTNSALAAKPESKYVHTQNADSDHVLNKKILAPELGGAQCEMLAQLLFFNFWPSLRADYWVGGPHIDMILNSLPLCLPGCVVRPCQGEPPLLYLRQQAE